MTDDRQQRARNLLAAEYERDGMKVEAHHTRFTPGIPYSQHTEPALRAIAQAETDTEARIVELIGMEIDYQDNPMSREQAKCCDAVIKALRGLLERISEGDHRLSPENSQ